MSGAASNSSSAVTEAVTVAAATGDGAAAEGRVSGPGKLGMGIFLITDAMGFGAMLIAYGVLRSRATTWPEPTDRLAIPLAAAMTLALLTSSLMVLFALTAARARRRGAARAWLAVTIACGAGFLGAQGYEYQHLVAGPVPMGLTTDLFASTFFAITGFHGVHVLAGLVVLCLALVRGGSAGPRAGAVEVAALYWHFVDVAWVPIFTFVYLLPVR